MMEKEPRRMLTEDERANRRREIRATLGERAYRFAPYTSKNIGRKRKSGKNYNQPYADPGQPEAEKFGTDWLGPNQSPKR